MIGRTSNSVVALLAVLFMAVLCPAAVYAEDAGQADAVQSGGIPKLVVTPEKFDFGEVQEGEKPEATFQVRNEGDGTLLIHDVKKSCGCTVTSVDKKSLEPGETTTIKAVYNSTGYRGGKVTKAVTIMSNDPANSKKVVYLGGTVKTKPAPQISLTAPGITSLRMKMGQTDKRLVKVGNRGELDLVITEITAPPGVQITIGDYVIDPGRTLLMELTLEPNQETDMELFIDPQLDEPGRFNERISIRSNSKGRPVTAFMVSGVME